MVLERKEKRQVHQPGTQVIQRLLMGLLEGFLLFCQLHNGLIQGCHLLYKAQLNRILGCTKRSVVSRSREVILSLCSALEHFSRACCDKTSGNSVKLNEGRFRLDIRKKFWNRLPREVVDVPSLETSKVKLDGALSNLIQLKMSLLIAGSFTIFSSNSFLFASDFASSSLVFSNSSFMLAISFSDSALFSKGLILKNSFIQGQCLTFMNARMLYWMQKMDSLKHN
ncbi:hypothetical protein QYF61_005324 [Mycteria americana]|uniref:Uncharacterized protein n=1 Tax=Mycteria americana TaxID=33587 RepID=A0AAN7RWV9_MYCAM|nr:hypothetical protein QYF61_005324 [Mycteria americana]